MLIYGFPVVRLVEQLYMHQELYSRKKKKKKKKKKQVLTLFITKADPIMYWKWDIFGEVIANITSVVVFLSITIGYYDYTLWRGLARIN